MTIATSTMTFPAASEIKGSPTGPAGAVPSSATSQAAPPLLTTTDLDDPDLFVTIRRVPLLDVHQDPEKGDISEALLRLIARNTNAKVARGNFPAVTLGHTRFKVVTQDGERSVEKEHDELE